MHELNLNQAIAALEGDLWALRTERGETHAVVWVDRDNLHTAHVTSGFKEMFGFTMEHLANRVPIEVLRPGMQLSPAFISRLTQLLAAEIHAFSWAGFLCNIKGTLLLVVVRFRAWRHEGEIVGVRARIEPIDLFGASVPPPISAPRAGWSAGMVPC